MHMLELTGGVQSCSIQWGMCCPQDAVHTLRFGQNLLTRGRWQTLTYGDIATEEKLCFLYQFEHQSIELTSFAAIRWLLAAFLDE